MDNRDQTVEQWIDTWDTGWQAKEIAIEKVKIKKSQEQNNRGDHKLVHENLESMKEWLDDPEHVFPRIVVNEENGRYMIIDGNHRTAASQAVGRTTIQAYVVKVDLQTFDSMTLSANMRNGLSLSRKEIMDLAISLSVRIGPAAAASQAGISVNALQTEMRIQSGFRKTHSALGLHKEAVGREKARHLNRLDVDQIEALGKSLVGAKADEVERSVRNILDAPASDQLVRAKQESERLDKTRRDKKRPAASSQRGMTTATMRAQLTKITKFLEDHPEGWQDKGLVNAVAALVNLGNKELGNG